MKKEVEKKTVGAARRPSRRPPHRPELITLLTIILVMSTTLKTGVDADPDLMRNIFHAALSLLVSQ